MRQRPAGALNAANSRHSACYHRRHDRPFAFPFPWSGLLALEPFLASPQPATRGTEVERTDDAEAAEAQAVARRIVDLLSDKQASDILLLDIRAVSLIADYFVIATAGSERQTGAILKDLGDKIQEEFRRKPLHVEGRADSGWVLLDFGDVIVHVFTAAQRDFYRLEDLWQAAVPVLRLQ